MRARLAVNEDQFRKVTYVALAALTLIVFTGAAVRLSDSGLGCPTWPRCYGHVYPPMALHPLIEFGNRALSGFVGVITVVVMVLAFTRRPFRRDLAWLAVSLPLGVVAQAVLGGFTVREKLAPGFVMSHFLLSMVILIFAVWLAWRATYPQGARPRSADRAAGLVGAGAVRPVCADAGRRDARDRGRTALRRHRRPAHQAADVQGSRTRSSGPCTSTRRSRRSSASRRSSSGCSSASAAVELDPLEPLTVLGILLAAQGLVGAVQYELKLPGQMVWVHVVLATITWLVSLWAVADRGPDRKPGTGRIRTQSIATIVAEWSRSVPAS